MTSHHKITFKGYVNNEIHCENQYLHLTPFKLIESTACENIQLLYDPAFDKYCVLSRTCLEYAENLDHANRLYKEHISKFN
ncbi:hypothetical protein [Gaetbulibacter jejuensis]|uniref:hypothetical protein n=1 Tax=Gaetbulibacter jejuensis TaxID=584607 RepID=UPI00300853BE